MRLCRHFGQSQTPRSWLLFGFPLNQPERVSFLLFGGSGVSHVPTIQSTNSGPEQRWRPKKRGTKPTAPGRDPARTREAESQALYMASKPCTWMRAFPEERRPSLGCEICSPEKFDCWFNTEIPMSWPKKTYKSQHPLAKCAKVPFFSASFPGRPSHLSLVLEGSPRASEWKRI